MAGLFKKSDKLTFRPGQPGGRLRWLKRTALGLVIFVVLFALAGFFLVPVIAKSKLQEILSAELNRPVTIERIEVNPFLPNARLSGLKVTEPGGGTTALSFARLEIDGSWRSITQRAPILAGVRLVDPYLKVVRLANGRYSFQDLIDKSAAKPPSNDPTPRFAVANIELVNGTIEFDDQPKKAVHNVTGIAIKVPFISSLPVDQQVNVEPKVAASINGTQFAADGTTHPFSLTRESVLHVDIGTTDIKRYLEYLPVALPVKIESARLAATAKIEFAQPPDAQPTITVRGQAKVSDLDVRERGGQPLLKLAALNIESAVLAPLAGRYSVGKVTVDAPEIIMHRRHDQQRFFESILDAPKAAAPVTAKAAEADAKPPDAAAAPPALSWQVDQLLLNGGTLEFNDQLFAAKPLAVKATPIDLELKNLSSRPGSQASYNLTLKTTRNEQLATSGALGFDPVLVEGKLDIEKIALNSWWWIVEPLVALDLTDGELAISGQYKVAIEHDAPPRIDLTDWSARLRNLGLRQRWDKAELLRIPALDVSGIAVDPEQHKVVIGSLESNSGRMLVRRERDGQLNLARVTAPAGTAPAKTNPPAASVSSKDAPATPGWTLLMNKLLIDRYFVDIEDQSAGKKADIRIDGLRIAAEGLGNEAGQRGKVDFRARFNRRGTLQVTGPLGLNPVAGKFRIDANSLSIVPLQPYFTEYVNAIISNGLVSAKGEASLDLPAGKAPKVAYKGSFTIASFGAVTKAGNEDLLRWKTLNLSSIDLSLDPLKVDIAEIALDDFYSRLIINPEGRFNLQDVLVAQGGAAGAKGDGKADGGKEDGSDADAAAGADEAKPAKPPAGAEPPGPSAQAPPQTEMVLRGDVAVPVARTESAPAPVRPPEPAGPARNIRVGRVTLTNGNIDFSDFFIKPNYSANLTGMNGSVSQISPDTAGDVELRGKVDNVGAVEILGKINPLARSLFLDLQANASDIDLPRLSPYSVKYMGYGIQKGKLSAKVKYAVVDRRLTAENNIVLDQLTFGDKVDSPTATKLPVLFAVSLLKDRHGVIDVNLPISGSLDDPKFSVGGIVLRIIFNLIVKAVTAPFSLLASLGGSGEEMSYLEFAPGRAALPADAEKKLQSLAKALTDRPGLKLDLSGRADPEPDREALRKLAVERLVKAQKLKDTVKSGTAAGAVDDVKIEPGEYEKYLTMAYKAAEFTRPRNALGFLKDQPVPDMEKMLFDNTRLDDSALQELASRRAQTAKDWLVETGKIAGERLFVTASRLGGEGIKGGGKPTRVDLSLK